MLLSQIWRLVNSPCTYVIKNLKSTRRDIAKDNLLSRDNKYSFKISDTYRIMVHDLYDHIHTVAQHTVRQFLFFYLNRSWETALHTHTLVNWDFVEQVVSSSAKLISCQWGLWGHRSCWLGSLLIAFSTWSYCR